MKIWNLVAILAMSCLLPILAQKQDNGTDTSGSTCENELGQFCIDKNDTHKCMFPLAKPECPAGKQCCKTFPKDYDSASLPLTKEKKCTYKCPCCIASVDEQITYLESAMKDQHRQIYCAIKGYQMAFGDSCYFISTSKGTWFDAQEKCVDMGGNLVTTDNHEEFSFLQDQVTQSPWIGSNDWGAWIGLHDIEVEGQYAWIADGSIHQIPESWWGPYEPNNAGGKEDCVHYFNRDGQTLLNDLPCSESAFYICEMPSVNI